ncbi:hypothetical protein ACPC54_39815 [Kitasatospora sp. NPDC094028]
MSGFSDQLMIRYLNPQLVHDLLAPPAPTTPTTPPAPPDRTLLRNLLTTVYEPGVIEIRSVDAVAVERTDFQVPLGAPTTVRGSWEKLLPDTAQSRAVLEIPPVGPPLWIDMALDTVVTSQVALTEGALASFDSANLAGLTRDEFVARFAFLDLPDLMNRAGVATFAELQAQFPRLYRLHYATPPPGAAGREFRLRISALFFPDLDLEGALRRLARSRQALDDSSPRPDEYDGGALLAASAWLAVFPAAALGLPGAPGTQQQVTDLLHAAGFGAAFETVP